MIIQTVASISYKTCSIQISGHHWSRQTRLYFEEQIDILAIFKQQLLRNCLPCWWNFWVRAAQWWSLFSWSWLCLPRGIQPNNPPSEHWLVSSVTPWPCPAHHEPLPVISQDCIGAVLHVFASIFGGQHSNIIMSQMVNSAKQVFLYALYARLKNGRIMPWQCPSVRLSVRLEIGIPVKGDNKTLPQIHATIKMHKNPVKFRFIIGAKNCVTKQVAKKLVKILQLIMKIHRRYCNKIYTGIERFWIIENNA